MVPPRIAHVFSTFDHGGAEARATRLMNHWGDQLNHAILVGVPEAMGARDAIDAAVTATFPVEAAALVVGVPGLARLYKIAQSLIGFSLILTYSWGAMDVVMAHRLFGKRFKLAPLIHHEDGFTEPEPTLRNWQRHSFRRIALQSSHALVVPSHMLAQVARDKWHVPEQKIMRIPNGIDVESFTHGQRAGSLAGLADAKAAGRVVVGTVAGLRPVKNLPRLVRAVAQTGLDMHLVIAGDGSERDAIMQEAERTGIANRGLLPGFLKNPADDMGHFDIFALSSDCEQYPLAMVEAMAAGLPVVSTDVGDVRQMVSAANLPFIVPVQDEAALAGALRTLAGNAALRAKLGAENRARAVADNQEQVMFAAYEQLYGRAMGTGAFPSAVAA